MEYKLDRQFNTISAELTQSHRCKRKICLIKIKMSNQDNVSIILNYNRFQGYLNVTVKSNL